MNMETNKIFAALLVAGITAYACGFAGRAFVHSHKLEKNAYEVEVAESAGGETPAAPAVDEPIDTLLATADAARGEKLAKVCGACHTFDPGGRNGVGPNLSGVVGRDKGAHEGFAYSEAMKGKGGKWDAESLNLLLFKPSAYIPGTKMNFAGLKKPEDRAALVKWLETKK
jgi:cytochrome c